jgi:hypothetical protein
MTNRLDPYYTGPATDPAAEPTPTELQAWFRGREAWVNDKLSATWEGLVRAIDAKLEPVTKQLSELQRQADATARLLDQQIMDRNPAVMELRRQVEDVTRHLRSHVVAEQPHSLTSYPISRLRQVEDAVRSLSRDFTHHLDLHEGLDDGDEPDGVLTGPTGDGQSDLNMVKYSQQLREAYRTFMRYAADPTIPKQRFDLEVHEFRERVFELTSWMRTTLAYREGQGAQAD